MKVTTTEYFCDICEAEIIEKDAKDYDRNRIKLDVDDSVFYLDISATDKDGNGLLFCERCKRKHLMNILNRIS